MAIFGGIKVPIFGSLTVINGRVLSEGWGEPDYNLCRPTPTDKQVSPKANFFIYQPNYML